MKVLLLATSYPTETGGLGAYVERLADGLASNGHVVNVAVRSVTELPPRTNGSKSTTSVSWEPTIKSLVQLIRESDVTHMNGFWLLPAAIALAFRKPLIWTHHEYDTTCPIGVGWFRDQSTSFALRRCVACMAERGLATQIPRRFGLLPVRRAIARLARANLTPSEYVGKRLGLPRNVVIEHGTEEAEVVQPPATMSPIFLFLGRLVREKGCDILIDAVDLCRDANVNLVVDVCGDGPERATLEDQVRSMGLESIVSFSGSIQRAEVVRKFATARALVVPSRWDEVAGFVALESMAAGIPVIASRVGGLAEMVGSAGVLVERGSPRALAAAILELARDPNLANELGRQGYSRHRRKFRLERMIRDHERVYEQIRTSRAHQPLAHVGQGSQ